MLRFGWWGTVAVWLVVLKIMGLTAWPWSWVLAPLPLYGLLYMTSACVMFYVAFILVPWIERRRRENRMRLRMR